MLNLDCSLGWGTTANRHVTSALSVPDHRGLRVCPYDFMAIGSSGAGHIRPSPAELSSRRGYAFQSTLIHVLKSERGEQQPAVAHFEPDLPHCSCSLQLLRRPPKERNINEGLAAVDHKRFTETAGPIVSGSRYVSSMNWEAILDDVGSLHNLPLNSYHTVPALWPS